MARSLDKHLNDAEIEELARACTADLGGPGMRVGRHLTESERHSECCPDCSQKVRIQKDMQLTFNGAAGDDSAGALSCWFGVS